MIDGLTFPRDTGGTGTTTSTIGKRVDRGLWGAIRNANRIDLVIEFLRAA
jgi:hypothetical protein